MPGRLIEAGPWRGGGARCGRGRRRVGVGPGRGRQEAADEARQYLGHGIDPTGGVGRDEQSELAPGHQKQDALEPLPAAVVHEDTVTVRHAVHEAVGVAAQARVGGEGRFVQLSSGRRREDRGGPVPAVVQLGNHEMRHVGGGRTDRSVGGELVELERDPPHRLGIGVVAAGQVVRERSGHRLGRGAVGHAQRPEQVLPEVAVVGLAADLGHEIAGQRDAVVGVRRDLARRPDPGRHIGRQVLLQGVTSAAVRAAVPMTLSSKPEVWSISVCNVTGWAYVAGILNPVRYRLTSALRSSLPAWTCCITAVHVNSFVIDAMRTRDRSGSKATACSRSARP